MIDRSPESGSAVTTSAPHARLLASSAAGLLIQFVLQFAIGLWLSRNYAPTVGGAHASVAAMHAGGLDRFLQAAHYWGSAVLILHSLVHLLAMTWLGWFRPPHGLRYVSAILTFLCAIGFQLTGNLLPFDRHGVQTAAIEASIGARAPVVGQSIGRATMGGAEVGQGTLSLWYTVHHWVLPALAILALGLALYAHIKLRDMPKEDPKVVWLPTALVAVLAAVVASPFGSAASPADYDAFAARSSWYVWPLHGLLRLFDSISSGLGWVGAMLIPGLLLAFLFILPLGRDRVPVKAARAVLVAAAALMGVATLLFAGAPASLTGTRDPASAVATKPPATSTFDKVLAEKGRAKFNELPCADCHGKDGKEAKGGPSLTRAWQRHSDADYYIRYIQKPTAVQPDSTMPAFAELSQDDLKAIAEFLRSPK